MPDEIIVTNTLGFLFPTCAAQPTLEEMARFVKTLTADPNDFETAYKISTERSVFVKFKSEAAMTKALQQNASKHTFHYSNGKAVEVGMSVAGRSTRYVRVFDLPPEVPDQDISLVLEEYGKIKSVERERFPAHLGLGNLFTGVRGIHMEVDKDIPHTLRFVGRRGRVYYEGTKSKCYICLSEYHLKVACPNRKVHHDQNKDAQKPSTSTYASTAGGSTSSYESEVIEIAEQEKEAEGETTANEAAAHIGHALSKLIKESFQADVTKVAPAVAEENGEQKRFRFQDDPIYIRAKEIQRKQEQEKEAEEQRQQRKKSGARPKTGSFSPPTKKKY